MPQSSVSEEEKAETKARVQDIKSTNQQLQEQIHTLAQGVIDKQAEFKVLNCFLPLEARLCRGGGRLMLIHFFGFQTSFISNRAVLRLRSSFCFMVSFRHKPKQHKGCLNNTRRPCSVWLR